MGRRAGCASPEARVLETGRADRCSWPASTLTRSSPPRTIQNSSGPFSQPTCCCRTVLESCSVLGCWGAASPAVSRAAICSVLSARSMRLAGGGRFFLFGSRSETLQGAVERLRREWPLLDVVGTLAPPFKPWFSGAERQAFLEEINSCRPNVLWVCLGAPKQELWVKENLQQLRHLELIGAIGAAIDFYAGQYLGQACFGEAWASSGCPRWRRTRAGCGGEPWCQRPLSSGWSFARDLASTMIPVE